MLNDEERNAAYRKAIEETIENFATKQQQDGRQQDLTVLDVGTGVVSIYQGLLVLSFIFLPSILNLIFKDLEFSLCLHPIRHPKWKRKYSPVRFHQVIKMRTQPIIPLISFLGHFRSFKVVTSKKSFCNTKQKGVISVLVVQPWSKRLQMSSRWTKKRSRSFQNSPLN